jgi:hypothetical protein
MPHSFGRANKFLARQIPGQVATTLPKPLADHHHSKIVTNNGA